MPAIPSPTDLAPEVIDLGRRNQPCFFNGNWQAHVWFEEEWTVEPNCDCAPFSGLELRCENCHKQATEEEERVFYSTTARTMYGCMLDPSKPYNYDNGTVDLLDDLPF